MSAGMEIMRLVYNMILGLHGEVRHESTQKSGTYAGKNAGRARYKRDKMPSI